MDVRWLPVPLRSWFWIPFVIVLVLAAIGLEVALHFSNKNQGERSGPKKFLFFSTVRTGWESNGGIGNTESALHYVYVRLSARFTITFSNLMSVLL